MCPLLLQDQFVVPPDKVPDLGVILDSRLNMEVHVANVVRCSFTNSGNHDDCIRRSYTDARQTLATAAFVTNRVDYCSAVLYGTSAVVIWRLQMVPDAATRLVVGLDKYQHITLVLRDILHWLPVPQRIQFKIVISYYTDKSSHVFACFVDLTKAFDRVNYRKLFTARCTLVQSAVLRSHVVCMSVCLSVCL